MAVALKRIEWQSVYPMDFYANESLGAWTNNNEAYRPARVNKTRNVKISASRGNGMSSPNDLQTGATCVNKGEQSCSGSSNVHSHNHACCGKLNACDQ